MRTLIAVAVVACAAAAHAEPTEGAANNRHAWHLGIEGMTDFPLSVGAQVWLETPYRFRITVSSGEMPDAYLQTINKIATSTGLYKQSTADFITELLDRAATFRLQFGWRPFRHRGAYVEGGFGIITVEKGLALASVIQLATSVPVPQQANVGFGYEVHTVIETLGVELGWIWNPWAGITLRASIGFAAPVGAQISIEPNFASTVQRPFTRFAEAYGEELIEKYLLVPTVGFAVGWTLF
jgi:hypothetical protein